MSCGSTLVALLTSDSQKIYCKTHNGEEIQRYCKNCNVFVCLECILDEHKGHVILKISELAETKKGEIAELLDKVKYNYLVELRARIQNNNRTKQLSRQCVMDCIKQMNRRAQLIRFHVDKIKYEMISELKDAHKYEFERLGEIERYLLHEENSLKGLAKSLEKSISAGKTKDMIHIGLAVEEVIRGLQQCPPAKADEMEFCAEEISQSSIEQLFGVCRDREVCVEVQTDDHNLSQLKVEKRLEVISSYKISEESLSCVIPRKDGTAWISATTERKIHLVSEAEIMKTVDLEDAVIDMCLSKNGTIIVALRGRNRLLRIQPNGQKLDFIDVKPLFPNGVHVNTHGDVYVSVIDKNSLDVESDSKRSVIKYTSTGTGLQKYAKDQKGERLFTLPRKLVATDEDYVCIIDNTSLFRGRVVCLVPSGEVKYIYSGREDLEIGNFNPTSIKCDSHCRIIISDFDNCLLHMLNKAGQLTCLLNSNQLGGFFGPCALGLDLQDSIWIGTYDGFIIKMAPYENAKEQKESQRSKHNLRNIFEEQTLSKDSKDGGIYTGEPVKKVDKANQPVASDENANKTTEVCTGPPAKRNNSANKTDVIGTVKGHENTKKDETDTVEQIQGNEKPNKTPVKSNDSADKKDVDRTVKTHENTKNINKASTGELVQDNEKGNKSTKIYTGTPVQSIDIGDKKEGKGTSKGNKNNNEKADVVKGDEKTNKMGDLHHGESGNVRGTTNNTEGYTRENTRKSITTTTENVKTTSRKGSRMSVKNSRKALSNLSVLVDNESKHDITSVIQNEPEYKQVPFVENHNLERKSNETRSETSNQTYNEQAKDIPSDEKKTSGTTQNTNENKASVTKIENKGKQEIRNISSNANLNIAEQTKEKNIEKDPPPSDLSVLSNDEGKDKKDEETNSNTNDNKSQRAIQINMLTEKSNTNKASTKTRDIKSKQTKELTVKQMPANKLAKHHQQTELIYATQKYAKQDDERKIKTNTSNSMEASKTNNAESSSEKSTNQSELKTDENESQTTGAVDKVSSTDNGDTEKAVITTANNTIDINKRNLEIEVDKASSKNDDKNVLDKNITTIKNKKKNDTKSNSDGDVAKASEKDKDEKTTISQMSITTSMKDDQISDLSIPVDKTSTKDDGKRGQISDILIAASGNKTNDENTRSSEGAVNKRSNDDNDEKEVISDKSVTTSNDEMNDRDKINSEASDNNLLNKDENNTGKLTTRKEKVKQKQTHVLQSATRNVRK